MKNEHEVNLSKEECMNETLNILKNKERAKIVRETDSSITFKRGSYWSFETTPESARLIATINFKGNGQTKIKGELNLGESMALDIITSIIAGIILIFSLYYFFQYLMYDYFYTNYQGWGMSYSEYVEFFYLLYNIMQILIAITPIALLISVGHSLYLKINGLRNIMNNIYSALSSTSKKDPRKTRTEILPVSNEKETIIRERVKVIYDIPERCPSCRAPLKYETIKMRGPTKAECGYCNTMFDLIEKEI